MQRPSHIGVSAILIEDQQRERKQQRADHALGLVDRIVIEGKLRVALAERRNQDTFIVGRTDSFGVLELARWQAIERAASAPGEEDA